jgi:hypothetical protein
MSATLSIDLFANSKLRLFSDLMSDDKFYEFCQKNYHLRIERNVDKILNIKAP